MQKLKIFILSILTTLSLYSEFVLKELVIVKKSLDTFSLKELIKYSYTNTSFILILILTIALFIFYQKYKDIPKKKPYNILSLIFTFFLVFGFSYSVVKDSSLVTGNIILLLVSLIKFITYYLLLSTIINLISNKLKSFDIKNIKLPNILQKFQNYYEKHPYKTIIIFILICWLPYFISFYPAILSPDPSNQIKQYFGIATSYIESVNLVDPNVLITNHHPIFHTFILGGFAKIGYLLGNLNFGLFLFTIFQVFVVISAMTYALVYLKKQQLPFIYRFIILLMFSLIPVFPLYAMSSVKDTFFGALLIFYIIEVHKIMTNNYKPKEYIIFTLLLIIMLLVRHNAIYILAVSLLVLLIILKSKRLPLFIVLISSIFIYTTHNKIILPIYHISPGSIREMLSVPFQQTARYVKYYDNDLTNQDKKIIDKILNYDTLKDRYKPNISDPVKNEFNKDATNEDLKAYLNVWFKGLLKHPGVYIDATINNVYGYFYPNTSNWYVYYNYDKRLSESNLNYHYNKLKIPRNILSAYATSYPYIPVLGAQVNIGFTVWIYMYLICYLIVNKAKKFITLLIPAFMLLFTCIVGPVNTYFRYIFPLVITLPLIIGLIYTNKK